MPVCPKCRKLISEKRYDRHLRRCGTSHKHVAQSLYVPSATAQVESPNRGITYGPPSSSFGRRVKRTQRWVPWAVAALVIAGVFLVYFTIPAKL